MMAPEEVAPRRSGAPLMNVLYYRTADNIVVWRYS